MDHIRVCPYDAYLKGFEDAIHFTYLDDEVMKKLKFWEKGYSDSMNGKPQMEIEVFSEWIEMEELV